MEFVQYNHGVVEKQAKEDGLTRYVKFIIYMAKERIKRDENLAGIKTVHICDYLNKTPRLTEFGSPLTGE